MKAKARIPEGVLRKTRSVESPNLPTNPPQSITRTKTTEGRLSSGPIRIREAPTNNSNNNSTKSIYHTVDMLSISPLQPSASMMLLNKTAEVISTRQGGDILRRMPIQTTTQVFEVRKNPKDFSGLSRQESLLAVFKPVTDDEDAYLVKSQVHSVKFTAEERALRERAAYVLDKAYHGFSRVPATALARLQDNNGSLQEYVQSEGTAEENPLLVGAASAEEVQRLAVLDCRIFNLDRHGGNVLVSKLNTTTTTTGVIEEEEEEESIFTLGGEEENINGGGGVILTPIDHSLSLPPWSDLTGCWLDWAYWPQAENILCSATLEHIKSLDYIADAKKLEEVGIKPECIVTNSICTIILQTFAKYGSEVTLKTFAEFFQRPYPVGHKLHHFESPLEHVLNEVCAREGVDRSALPKRDFLRKFEEHLITVVKNEDWRAFVV